MHRLVSFELDKIWRKKGFLLSVCVLVVLNIFLLWYTNLSDGSAPALSSYQAFQEKIAPMSEEEKADYILELKEKIDGICLVQEVLFMQRMESEAGDSFAEQTLAQNPGVFEKYYELYESGGYLTFTDSLDQEKVLIDEIYEEWEKVSSYESYLQSVQENKNTLSGISIFGQQDEDNFSARNIKKSAEDYAVLTADQISWRSGKALRGATESRWTDLLLLLSIFLCVGNLILEEKEKKLFYVTRGTKNGIIPSILGKLSALLTHCLFMTILLYGVNLLYYGGTVGLGDLTARIQSVAAYMESSLSISIWQYILLSVLTKALVLFGTGAILTAFCVAAENILMPYLIGILLWGISFLLYSFVPTASKWTVFKYLNLAGIMKTEKLYGGYLNLDLFGYPVSRMELSWLITMLIVVVGILLCLILFSRGSHLELKNKKQRALFSFKPHGSAVLHEGYKIMVTNKAALILLIFGVLIGYRILSQSYSPSVQEQYYQDIMFQLEGELTAEKELLIQEEQARYTEAFEQIELIEQKVLEGKITESAAEQLKSQWYAITAFYPSFERVWQQYENICENGGDFIYDTGYLYVFGALNEEALIDFLLLTLGVIFAFSNVISMEDQRGSWNLISATQQGKRKILCHKFAICGVATAVVSLVPFVCKIIRVSSVYPLRGLGNLVNNIPYCENFPIYISVWFFLLLMVLSQAVCLMAVTAIVLGLSCWRKNHVQTIFFAVLLLAIPLVLRLLGFDFAEWFSIYPFYSWTGRLG